MRQAVFRLAGVRSAEGEPLTVIQPNARVYLELPAGARAGDLLRRRRD
jgi:putative protease